MHDKQQKLEAPALGAQQAEFYAALGTLNARLVTRVFQNPSETGDVTKWIRGAIGDTIESHCPVGTVHDPLTGECVSTTHMDPDDIGPVNPNA